MSSSPEPELWSSRLGAILAVAGSAVGLGNFIRFPALAAEYGGGAFMIAYFVSFLLIGIPLCWVEWTVGRMGGGLGFHSAAGILHATFRRPWARYLGGLGIAIVILLYFYYVYIESWCLGYAYHAVVGSFETEGLNFGQFFTDYTGAARDGSAFHFGPSQVGLFVVATFLINFWFIHRGVAKGIEKVCAYALPALVLLALVILVRVLTLGTPDPAKPELNVLNGLGYLWNPGEVLEDLRRPELWLAAAGQIFFSLSVGFGAIITYASYLRKQDDVVLSGLTAASANEFCEVGLGGLITVPAAFVFFGAAGIVGMGTFGLGFNVLPHVFAQMAFGQFFATIFYLLLFLAAITSSLSMLQPGIAFFEEGLGLGRKAAMGVLGLLTALGTSLIWWFSKDLKALDTIDFWIGTVGIFICGTVLIITFGWIIGIDEGVAEAHQGAEMRIPSFYKPIMKYITPLYLLGIFVMFILANVFGWNFQFGARAEFKPTSYITDLVGDTPSAPARIAFGFIVITIIFVTLLVSQAGKRWETTARNKGGYNP